MKIGFFDSGKGGKFVAEYFHSAWPEYNLCILDDAENVPYGNKSEEILKELFTQKTIELFQNDCVLVIVACNTLSVGLVRYLQDTLIKDHYSNHRILGVVVPTVEEITQSPEQSFLILATEGTVASGRYNNECAIQCPQKIIYTVAVSELATLIQHGNIQQAETLALSVINKAFNEHPFEVIVLACTHYIILKDFLGITFPNIRIISQDVIISDKLKQYLFEHPEIETKIDKGRMTVYL